MRLYLISSFSASLYNISIIVSGVNGIAIAIAIAATVTAGAAAIFCHDTQGVSCNEYSQRDGCQRGQ